MPYPFDDVCDCGRALRDEDHDCSAWDTAVAWFADTISKGFAVELLNTWAQSESRVVRLCAVGSRGPTFDLGNRVHNALVKGGGK